MKNKEEAEPVDTLFEIALSVNRSLPRASPAKRAGERENSSSDLESNGTFVAIMGFTE